MKIAYISAKEDPRHSGVYKKIRGQIQGLKDSGISVELIENKEIEKWKKALPFSSRSYDWRKIDIPSDTDVIYIRYQLSDLPFVRALKRWKKKYHNVPIILEIPMYPYINELKKISNSITLFRDKFYSRYVHKYIDRIVTFTSHKEILGVKTIQMVNGIEVDNVKPKKQSENKDQINIIAVALVNFSHGYDRFIGGLKEYYDIYKGEKNVVFHLVGEGSALSKLKKMVDEDSLEKHVIFYGFKSGQELDHLYDLADIGIDVLGGHRKGDCWFGTLKSREYLSKGLPFITEYEVPDDLQPIRKYILKVPDDESPVDIKEVIRFYERIAKTDPIKDMRDFAKGYCDVSVVMKPLIDYLKGVVL